MTISLDYNYCSIQGAAIALSPAEGAELSPENTATEMVCAVLVNSSLVERDVNLTFSFTALTAGINNKSKWLFQLDLLG